jgi:hypothetical protein
MPLLRTTPPIVAATVIALISLLVRLRLSYLGLSPISFVLPDPPDFSPDNRLANVDIERIGTDDLVYPECLVASRNGKYMFASLGDGRIARLSDIDEPGVVPAWDAILRTGSIPLRDDDDDDDDDATNPSPPAAIRAARARCGLGGPSDDHPIIGPSEEDCGRPLGMWLEHGRSDDDDDGDDDVLYIADAYRGLLAATNLYGPGLARMRVLATGASSDPTDYAFRLLNSVVRMPGGGGADEDGVGGGDVYMTETSTRFRRRRIFHAAMDGASDGRLLRHRAGSGVVDVAAGGIYMANGLAPTHDGTGLLVVSGVRILRYDLTRGTMDEEPFVGVMPGTGDNVKAMEALPNGTACKCYWVGLGGKYILPFSLLRYLSDKPWLRSALLAFVPYRKIIDLIPKWTALAVYDEKGVLITTLTDDGMAMGGLIAPWISEAEPVGNYIYLASWYNPFLARFDRRDVKFD